MTRNGVLDPSVPRFQPGASKPQQNGRAASPPLTLNMNSQASGTSSHLQSSYELVKADRSMHDTQEQMAEIKDVVGRDAQKQITEIKAVVGRDLQELHSQLQHLQYQISSGQVATLDKGPSVLEVNIAAPEAMVQRFGPFVTAEVYIEQAEAFEDKAAELKKTAKYLLQSASNTEGGAQILLGAPKPDQQPSASDTPMHDSAHRSQLEKATTAADIEVVADEGNKGSTNNNTTEWKPMPIRNIEVIPVTELTDTPATFSWEFLKLTLQGEQWSPGYYFVQTTDNILPSKSYYILDATYEPFLPSQPGHHGAKLTVFFNNPIDSVAGDVPTEENFMHVPVFIRSERQNGYAYYGNYSQKRFSDKLDYERVMALPEKVRRYWAEQLAAGERPEWVTKELMQHFWPRPEYLGPLPSGSGDDEKRVANELKAYAEELMEWEKDARLKAQMLTSETLMKAFDAADSAVEPGLRMWWEYLECVEFDSDFYEMLVKLKDLPLPTSAPKRASKAAAAPSTGPTVPSGSADRTTAVDGLAASSGGYGASSSFPNVRTAEQVEANKSPHAAPPAGDLDLAKQLNEAFKKAGGRDRRGGKGRAEGGIKW